MKILTRLTLWQCAVLLLGLLIMASGMYYELVFERRAAKAARLPKESMDEEVLEVILVYCAPAMLVAVTLGWWKMRKALAPLEALTAAAGRIQVHNLTERLPGAAPGDELDTLSQVLNATMARLDQSVVQMREFSVHASHELKTPLAVLHGEVEMLLQEPTTTAPQREAFGSLLDEIQRLSKIVAGLDFLSRADAGVAVIARAPVRLHELVADIVVDAHMLSRNTGIAVNVSRCDEAFVLGDRHRLRQLLMNLTENALKYNIPNGRIEFTLAQIGERCVMEIRNTGAGISPENLPRAFDRFFRGDPSHSSEIEGCGLGLAIARWIVNAHQGEIKIESELGGWTTVTCTLAQTTPEQMTTDPPTSSSPTSV